MSLAVADGWAMADSYSNGRIPVAQGLTGWVVRHRQSLLVDDLLADPVHVPPRSGIQPARSWLGVPLIARDRIIGAAAVQSSEPRAFNMADRRFLESVASQVAIAIENARLYAEVSARVGGSAGCMPPRRTWAPIWSRAWFCTSWPNTWPKPWT